MAMLEDGLGGSVIAMAALLSGALLVRRAAPDQKPNLRSLVASGLRLFAEAEFEAQDGVISTLAQRTVEALLQAMPQHPANGGANDAARHIIGRYARAARARSQRQGWHERDSQARYRHHMRKLKAAVSRASRQLPPDQHAWLSQVGSDIREDW